MHTAPPCAPKTWDIFCQVIDNFGDIGVCWRLATGLAAQGLQVRLWIDDACALHWMAPQGCAGVNVHAWSQPLALDGLAPGDVLVEAFGCTIAPEFIAHCAAHTAANAINGINITQPIWINLEYLSAEPYVERCHAMPSPVLSGPAAGWTKWFFYPGFSPGTGGLLREADLPQRQASFQRGDWLHRQGIAETDTLYLSLFCYEPVALGPLLVQLDTGAAAVQLLVTPGRATAAVQTEILSKKWLNRPLDMRDKLSISYIQSSSQRDFDHLLWASDLNFVRGEDSLVRALWAGAPLVWQIYPQADNAHHDKLEAFLDWLQAPPSLRQFHRVWNGVLPHRPSSLPALDLPAWRACIQAARTRLLQQDDLVTQLLSFCAEKS